MVWHMAYKRHICCMQICEYVKKTVFGMGFMGFMGFRHLPAARLAIAEVRERQSTMYNTGSIVFRGYVLCVLDGCVLCVLDVCGLCGLDVCVLVWGVCVLDVCGLCELDVCVLVWGLCVLVLDVWGAGVCVCVGVWEVCMERAMASSIRSSAAHVPLTPM
jgi:hypothetical protein